MLVKNFNFAQSCSRYCSKHGIDTIAKTFVTDIYFIHFLTKNCVLCGEPQNNAITSMRVTNKWTTRDRNFYQIR